MTEQGHDPRFASLLPVISSAWGPRVARDIRTRMLVSRDLHAGDRAHRHAPHPGRADVAHVPASDHARHDTPCCTRAVSRSPRPPPRTSDGTRYTYGAYPGACLASCSYPRGGSRSRRPTALITRRGGSRSRREVDLYKAAAEASHGSTRSRCRQPRQRASATLSITDAWRTSSRRSTRLPVSRRSLPPHTAQRQPTRSSSPEPSTIVTYLLHSMSSTKTTCS